MFLFILLGISYTMSSRTKFTIIQIILYTSKIIEKIANNNRLIWTCNGIVQILYPYTWIYKHCIKDAFPLTYNSKESIIYIFFKDASVNDAQDIQHTMPLGEFHEELKKRSLMLLSSKNNISHSWVGLYNITSSLL